MTADKPFFEAGYSPMALVALEMGGPETEKQMKSLLEATVRAVNDDLAISASLKVAKVGSSSFMRQCDLRATPDGPIVLKTFTSWNHSRQCWRILVEAPEEDWVERGRMKTEMN